MFSFPQVWFCAFRENAIQIDNKRADGWSRQLRRMQSSHANCVATDGQRCCLCAKKVLAQSITHSHTRTNTRAQKCVEQTSVVGAHTHKRSLASKIQMDLCSQFDHIDFVLMSQITIFRVDDVILVCSNLSKIKLRLWSFSPLIRRVIHWLYWENRICPALFPGCIAPRELCIKR